MSRKVLPQEITGTALALATILVGVVSAVPDVLGLLAGLQWTTRFPSAD